MSLTLTLFCHTKSVEKKEREETKGERDKRKEKERKVRRKEGKREEACVGSMVRMP